MPSGIGVFIPSITKMSPIPSMCWMCGARSRNLGSMWSMNAFGGSVTWESAEMIG